MHNLLVRMEQGSVLCSMRTSILCTFAHTSGFAAGAFNEGRSEEGGMANALTQFLDDENER